MLHASDNYVIALKFLYQCALYISKGNSNANAISKAQTDSKIDLGNSDQKMLVETITTFLDENKSKNKTVRYYQLIGFAMHLVGDIYAHRTMVPAYTVKDTNPVKPIESKSKTSANAKFGTNAFASPSAKKDGHSKSELRDMAKKSGTMKDKNLICTKWKCFQKTVNLGYMEFRDIKNFAANDNGHQSIYEDNPKFCTERYADAVLNCEVLFESLYYKSEFDGIVILYPTEKNVKLNGFKIFATEAGEDISWYDSSDWNQWSTADKY